MEINDDNYEHIVLVHGICHGAWCWFKLIDRLNSSATASGRLRHVTALDLGGCGLDPRQLDEVVTLSEYLQPLMDFFESLPSNERVMLVGHSYGGLPIALAMERFPEKVAVAVFVSAYMPNSSSSPGLLIQEYFGRTSTASLMDCRFNFEETVQNPPTVAVGPQYIANSLYAGCPSQDMELARMLMRPARLFAKEMMECELTGDRFGSVKRVFIMCEEDRVMKKDFQMFMIEASPPDEVKVLKGAPHMAMLSMPQELCLALDEIASKYTAEMVARSRSVVA